MLKLKCKNVNFIINARYLSTAKQPKKKLDKSYSHTVILPATEFPSFIAKENWAERDGRILKEAKFLDLYAWQRKNMRGKEFVLHDGPPYANGKPHIGHAVNKIMKDIILRSRLVQGRRVHYVPGWDCHGLPIELKAITKAEESLSPVEIRRKAREFAYNASQDQMKAFKQWGVLGDWDNQCYYTYDNKYVINQLQIFWKFYDKGLVFNDYKPVYWSPFSGTALAEAELVYNDNHISNALTVGFEIISDSVKSPCYLLIWTTTPWTLPANKTVFYSNKLDYSIVNIPNRPGNYIMATKLIPDLEKKLGGGITFVSKFPTEKLKDLQYRHPWFKEKIMQVHESPFTELLGTGFNHGAPAHGHEDFLLGLKYNISTECFVDDKGCYTKEAGDDLAGLDVLDKGSTYVMDKLKNDIVFHEKYKHKYPYDWRTNKPVIIKTSKQWFIDIESLKQQALESASKVNSRTEKLKTYLQSRPYWCLSRQRCWGVPIPAFFHKTSERPLISKSLIDHLCKLFESSSPDIWWTGSLEQLFPPKIREELCVDADSIVRGKDIMDIWFDSGVSWSYVLEGRESDICVEGYDQFGGWFQSSLLTSTAVLGRSPYKKLFVHGFAVDESGKKMSKSLGNVVDPADVLQGKNAYGIDTLRWWVATTGQKTHIPVSDTILQNSAEAVKKVRLTLRFLLGNLKDVSQNELENEKPSGYLDRYLLFLCYKMYHSVMSSYNEEKINQACDDLLNFTATNVSILYFTSIKDSLYCDFKNSERRKSVKITLYGILNTLCQCSAPVLPHMVEEVYTHHPLYKGERKFFYNREMWTPPEWWNDFQDEKLMSLASDLRNEVATLGGVKYQNDAYEITVEEDDYNLLKKLQADEVSADSELQEIFQVAEVRLMKGARKVTKVSHSYSSCPRCRRMKAIQNNALCTRCEAVLSSL